MLNGCRHSVCFAVIFNYCFCDQRFGFSSDIQVSLTTFYQSSNTEKQVFTLFTCKIEPEGYSNTSSIPDGHVL